MKKLKSSAAVFISLVMLCMGFSQSAVMAADGTASLRVYTNTVIQDNFLGANAVYHGFPYIPDKYHREYTDQQRETELSRLKAMSIKIVRTYYDVDFAWYNNEWNWQSPAMLGFYKWLDKMQEMGIKVALNAAWQCPSSINSTTKWPLEKSPLEVEGDWKASVANYAEFMYQSLYQMREVRGYKNVEYVLMFTEPQRTSGTLTSGGTQYEAWLDCVKALNDKLVEKGMRNDVKFVGPNEGSTATSKMVEWVAKNADRYIDIYTSHNYEPSGSTMDTYDNWLAWAKTGYNFAKATGKPYWFDEYGTFNEAFRKEGAYGTLLATAQTAFMNAGLQTSLLWTLFDQQWPNSDASHGDSFHDGLHKCGVAPSLRESEIPHKAYYSFSMISRYMGGEGTKVYKVSDANGVHLSAAKLPDGNWSVLVVNSNSSRQSFSLTFDKTMNATFYRHLYDPESVVPNAFARVIGADKSFEKITAGFKDTLPAGGVAVYTTIPDYDPSKPQIIEFSTRKYNLSENGVNLFPNGDFETVPAGNTGWNVSEFADGTVVSVVSDNAFSGGKSLRFDAQGGEEHTARLRIKVQPQTEYMLSAQIKGAMLSAQNRGDLTFGVANPSTGRFITFINEMLPEYESESVNCTGEKSMTPPSWDDRWHRRGCIFNTGALTEIDLIIKGKSSLAWFDDFILCKSESAVADKPESRAKAKVTDKNPGLKACSPEHNLFQNGNFSGEDVSMWKGPFIGVKDDPDRPSNRVLAYRGGNLPTGNYFKWIDVKPNTNYTFTMLMKVEDGCKVQIGLMDSQEPVPCNIGDAFTPRTDRWQVVSFSFDSGDNDRIALYLFDGGGAAYMDEFKLFESHYGVNFDTSDFISPDTGLEFPILAVTSAILACAAGFFVLTIKKRRSIRNIRES